MKSPPYDRFAQWIQQAKSMRQGNLQSSPAFAITLSSALGEDTARVGEALVDYLNEFDENAAGQWAVFDHEALYHIEKGGGVNSLPSWVRPSGGRLYRETRPAGHRALLDGMARLGTVVLVEDRAYVTTQQIPRVFHTRLSHPTNGIPEEDARPFHLLVNTRRFGADSVVSIIGDSALEWASRGHDPIDRVVDFVI